MKTLTVFLLFTLGLLFAPLATAAKPPSKPATTNAMTKPVKPALSESLPKPPDQSNTLQQGTIGTESELGVVWFFPKRGESL